MQWFLVGMMPIIAFVIADLFLPDKKAILVSIGIAFLLLLYFITTATSFDYLMIVDFVFLAALGWFSIKMNNSRFFKLQPAIISGLTALWLIYCQAFTGGYMVRMLPGLKPVFPPLLQEKIANKEFVALMNKLERATIIALLLHSVLMYWLARKSNVRWALGKVAIFPLILVVFFVFMSVL